MACELSLRAQTFRTTCCVRHVWDGDGGMLAAGTLPRF